MKKILVMFVLCLIMCGCGSKEMDVETLMKENEYIIIDVRTEKEYNESHLEGAINIPYDEIDKNINLDKDKLIFVYCRSGSRSQIAFETLTNLGYNAYNLGAFEEIDLPKK